MPELIACIIAYNEEKLLPQCLESIVDKVDRIVLVEGRIAAFPGDSVHSADRTIDIALSYGCKVITRHYEWQDEAEMRSQYLIGKDGDWYIQIDADEKCMTPLPDINDLPDGVDSYAIQVRMLSDGHGKYRPRLFRHKGAMEYRNIHDALFSDDRLISNPNTTPKLDSIWFAHYQMARDYDRRINKNLYYRYGYEHEPKYRHLWRMTNHD